MDEEKEVYKEFLGQKELDRSLRLLDSALNSPGKSLLRVKKRAKHEHSSKEALNESQLNSTNVLQAKLLKELEEPFQYTAHSPESLANLSITIRPKEYRAFTKQSSISVQGAPTVDSAQKKLYFDFLEAWQSQSSEQEIFDTILEFVQTCADTVDSLRSTRNYLKVEERKILQLEAERNSWRLIYALYLDRIGSAELEDDEMEEEKMESWSEKNIISRLYKNNRTVREMQLVIDWLEQNKYLSHDQTEMKYFTDKTVSWENTLHQLQHKQIPYKSSREIVSELDVDAPRRQGRPLHDLDMEDDERLVNQMFHEIRCGQLEEAQKLCIHAGQSWRAAALEGWRLYHDPNYELNESEDRLPVEGNHNRDLWKLCTWRLCSDSKMPLKTRAYHAAYIGHLPSLLEASTTWEDRLWSYLKTIVDVSVEREVRLYSLKTYVEMPQGYWNNMMSLEEVFKELSAKEEPNSKDITDLFNIVNKYIILDEVSKLMEEVLKWIQGVKLNGMDSDHMPPNFLRYLTHVVLFLRRIGRSECEEVGDAVIKSYVKLLIEMRESTLVSWYVSQLSQEDQIYYYSSFLEEITDSDERAMCLDAAQEAGLNIDLITKTVVMNIRQQPSCGLDNGVGDIQPDVSREDLVKISALDWLLVHNKHRLELMVQTNALICFFLSQSNIQAARLAFAKVPDNSIDIIMYPYMSNTSIEDTFVNVALNNIPVHVSATTREYLCYKAYLEADESFNDWFQHFHNAKPIAPVLKPGATFTEKVSYEHKNNQYKIELERWKLAMENQTKTTKTLLFNILTFPRGWLQDDEEPQDNDRLIQLSGLRSIIIPKTCTLLHTVMSNMEDFVGCMTLADLVASRQHGIYKVFSRQKLRDFCKSVTESCLVLMDQHKDSLGYNLA